jgi:hypothetical protein
MGETFVLDAVEWRTPRKNLCSETIVLQATINTQKTRVKENGEFVRIFYDTRPCV